MNQQSESMPKLLMKNGGGKEHRRPFRLGSGDNVGVGGDVDDSETSQNHSATGSNVWGNSVLSTNHEAAIDYNEDEVNDEDLTSEEEDPVSDVRKVAALNSLINFLAEKNLHIFI